MTYLEEFIADVAIKRLQLMDAFYFAPTKKKRRGWRAKERDRQRSMRIYGTPRPPRRTKALTMAALDKLWALAGADAKGSDGNS